MVRDREPDAVSAYCLYCCHRYPNHHADIMVLFAKDRCGKTFTWSQLIRLIPVTTDPEVACDITQLQGFMGGTLAAVKPLMRRMV